MQVTNIFASVHDLIKMPKCILISPYMKMVMFSIMVKMWKSLYNKMTIYFKIFQKIKS